MKPLRQSITSVPGIRLGHAQNYDAITGCSVVLFPSGTICGVDQRGGAPGTRETDLLHPMHLVNEVHAILLTGGSAFGLDAASGVMRYLEEKNIGIQTVSGKVPIVPSAVIYDLDIGDGKIRPDASMGYEACINAVTQKADQIADNGNFGAGTGARVGNLMGHITAMKSGIGSAAMEIQPGLFISALFVVNAFGDVIDKNSGQILSGARSAEIGGIRIGSKGYFANTLQTMRTSTYSRLTHLFGGQNTVIGIVATNARFTKEEINKIAQMAHNGIAQVVRPAHTLLDGDTIFAAATNKKRADINLVGAYAAEVTALAINNAVRYAVPAGDLPSVSSVFPTKGDNYA